MPIDTLHPEYQKRLRDWGLLEDIYEGERAIKDAGIKYLPMLGGQDPGEYQAYKERGSFFNAFARTVIGLSGFIFRKPIKKKVPEQIENLLPGIMSTGHSFEDLCFEITSSVLKTGRTGLLVDSQGESNPYIALYEAQNIVNWKTEFVDGEEILQFVVLKESYDSSSEEIFDFEPKIQYRALILTESGVEISVYRKAGEIPGREAWVRTETYQPTIRGKRQRKIMFYFVGSEKNTAKINKPPLIDMAYVNISHWRLSVDYHHGLHFCSLPTPWAAGFDQRDQQLTIGPVRVWVSSDPQARCGYLEFTGQGLSAVKMAMGSAEEQMAILGARIIEQTRSRVETAEASRIRQSGESGALTTIANNVSSGLTFAMRGIAEWMGLDFDDVFVRLNTDFMDIKIGSEEITALIKAYQFGAMSLDTLLWNFDQGELLPPGVSLDEEKSKIEAGNKEKQNDQKENDILGADNVQPKMDDYLTLQKRRE